MTGLGERYRVRSTDCQFRSFRAREGGESKGDLDLPMCVP
jgi:hypothetical protein